MSFENSLTASYEMDIYFYIVFAFLCPQNFEYRQKVFLYGKILVKLVGF